MYVRIVGYFKRAGELIISFLRKRYKLIAAVALGSMLVQLVYPGSLAKPLVFSSGKYLGLHTSASLGNYYQDQAGKPLSVAIGEDKQELKLADVGISFDQQKAMSHVSRDAVWQRFIPLSIFWPVSMQPDNWQSVDTKKLEDFAAKRSSEHYRPAKSATAARNEKGEFILTKSEAGRQISKEEIVASLKSSHIERSAAVSIASHSIDPTISNSMVNEVIEKTKLANIQPIDFSVASKTYALPADTIQPWLTIEIDEDKKQAQLGYDDAQIKDWIDSHIAVINSGKPAIITLRDGVEISRVQGTAGRGVDKTKALVDIKHAIDTKQPKISGEVVALPIAKQTVRTYSVTNNGLNIMIDEWSKEYPGMEAGVYLHELSGRGLSAEKNADNSMFAASVYKLWVAQFVLERTDPNAIAYGSKTYGQCLQAMIHVSDNECPHQIIDKHGASTMNAYVAGNDFGRTSMSSNSTSPRDAGHFLERLFSGSLLDGTKTNQLLGLLQGQVYRSGIPAGSPGATVADKPGFYGGSWHDAAIVQGPRSTYVLVIMTKGPGVLAVKTLAQRIYQTLN